MAMAFYQQEKLIFFPENLPANHVFNFEQEFEEHFIPASDGVTLHGMLFKSPTSSKGLFFYLHGNAGSVDSWGWATKTYTDLGYDIFILDYRGYGKSEGSVTSEKQFYEDAQEVYNYVKNHYSESKIIIAGYSIGTGAAAMLASANNPQLLLLQAPYYSLSDLMKSLYPFVPSFLLKYKFTTYQYIERTRAPIVIFHGDKDEIIYPGSTEKLKRHLKPTDQVFILKGLGHNGMNESPEYKRKLAAVLQVEA